MSDRTFDEAVLAAVDVMTDAGETPAPGQIGLRAQPAMTTLEVMRTAARLHEDGYLAIHDDGDGVIFYSLTTDGAERAAAITARGT